ncbi:CD0519/CD1768 family membrane protein [Ezakiella peruensis]|uniref:CD0519/CD1768 family membrane protein n=1 Tax=Ezakiella peruensis TaxID=1464038 RepID=UPI000C1B05BC|nr:hypothetical protein [Ezakiella peruensis]
MDEKHKLVPAVGREVIIFIVIFTTIFGLIGHKMGVINMINTIMQSSYAMIMDVCFYIMGVAVIAGALSGILGEFGVIALIDKLLSKLMGPLYDLPGAASLGVLTCYMSDNPAILSLAKDQNFVRYFKNYQLPALTNIGTSFGMGLIITSTMMGLKIDGSIKAALVGNLGAIIGSIVSVRIMMRFTKAYYGTEDSSLDFKELENRKLRVVREGSVGGRAINSLLEGGKNGVDMGLTIIPGVVVICSLVLLLTNGPGPEGYTGAANEGVAFLPWLGEKLSFILNPLFGFQNPSSIAVPITALGSAGAAMGLVPGLIESGSITANEIAVFTAICMCWSGYLSTHVAMMDSLGAKELTGKAIMSHTIGGICAGIAANLLYKLFMLF